MRREREDGAVLLMVLVALALLAALAGLVLRVSQSDLAGLAGERAAFAREDVIQSALATLGARLPADDLPQDGTAFSLPLPGGSVSLRIYAAQGLINPNFTRIPALQSALAALGATPEQAERLTLALIRHRDAANGLSFRSMSQVAGLFHRDPDLWPKVAPYLTLLGQSFAIDPVQAPLALRNIATPRGAEEVNFSDTGQPGTAGFYEIWLHVDDPVLDATDPEGLLWVHVSALAGRDRRLHIVARDWPAAREEDR